MIAWFRAFISRLLGFLTGRDPDRDFDEELETHLRMLTERFVRQGMTEEDAHYAARRRFGNRALVKEVRNGMWTFPSLEALRQDLRYGVRQFLSTPGVTAVIVLSLALGIGANTAIFSLINAVALKKLPVRAPEELELLTWTCGANPLPLAANTGYKYRDKVNGEVCSSFSYPFFEQLRADNQVLSGVFGFASLGSGKPSLNITIDGKASLIAGEMVTGGYFSGLGVSPILGRPITDEDESAVAAGAAVVSYRYWVDQLARNPAAAGTLIALNGIPFTIVGVAPADFFGVDSQSATDIWVPAAQWPGPAAWGKQPTATRSLFAAQDQFWLTIMGRLRPGTTLQQASASLSGRFNQNLTANLKPPVRPERPRLVLMPVATGLAGLTQQLSEPLMMLMIIMGLVLLIACANAAILLLARATARQSEIGVRLALGASRGRLIRQLLTESVLLASTGGGFGLLLGTWSIDALLRVLSSSGERVPRGVHPDPTVLGFTLGVSLLTGILFGLTPSLCATRVNVMPLLKGSTDGVSGDRRHLSLRLGNVLVVAQVAMSLFLLVAAGLFVSTLRNVRSQDLGFNRHNLLLFSVDPTAVNYDRAHLVNLYERLRERLQAAPGVRSATFSLLTLASGATNTERISIDAYRTGGGQNTEIFWNGVGPSFFETMGIPVVLGRSLDARDMGSSSRVALVNEIMSRYFFGGASPIGRRFSFSASRPPNNEFEIVGVVRNAKDSDLHEQSPRTIYIPYTQMPALPGVVHFEVRTALDAAGFIPSARRLLHELDPYLPILDMKTETEQIEQSLLQERFFAGLSTFFGAFALFLACVGLHGTVAYGVNRRTHELGIRLALGAQRRDILAMVVRKTLLLLLTGVAIGLPCALLGARLVSSMLFGLKPTEPITMLAATLLICTVGMLAGYLPARKASRVDPVTALRER